MSDQGNDAVMDVSKALSDHSPEREPSDAEDEELQLDLGSDGGSVSDENTERMAGNDDLKCKLIYEEVRKICHDILEVNTKGMRSSSGIASYVCNECKSEYTSDDETSGASVKVHVDRDNKSENKVDFYKNYDEEKSEVSALTIKTRDVNNSVTELNEVNNSNEKSLSFGSGQYTKENEVDHQTEYSDDFEEEDSVVSFAKREDSEKGRIGGCEKKERILFYENHTIEEDQRVQSDDTQEVFENNKPGIVYNNHIKESEYNQEESRAFRKIAAHDEMLCDDTLSVKSSQRPENEENTSLDWANLKSDKVVLDMAPIRSFQSSSSSRNMIKNSSFDDQFDFVDVPIPIEHQIPHLPTPLPRGMGPALTRAQWDACFVSEERRLDPHRYAAARATAYAGGIEEEIRMQVWHYLLCVYSEDATQAQRETVRATYGQMYEKLTLQWTNVFPEQESRFSTFRELHSAILKDVVRTDRAHPAHADDDSVKQRMLRNVLMAHGMFNFDLGYSQGMSDMLSVIALLTDSETEAFTCFSCLLTERCESNFRRDVRVFMVEKLTALQTLLRHFVPKLHAHLVRQHAEDMSFCFRWLLMLFKREFSINDTMLLWDVIFSCPYTPQFELFVAAALLKALSPQILQQHLAYDELLKFANNVAGNLNVRDVIVLTQEFYDEVARLIAEIDKSREVPVESYKPTLKDVLRVLSEVE